MKFQPGWTIAVAIALVLGVGTFAWLLRFDVVLRPDGSSILRNRFTGEVQVCNYRNECRAMPSVIARERREPIDPDFKRAMDDLDAELEKELEQKARAARLSKGPLRKFVDVIVSAVVGAAHPIFDLLDAVFGEPYYEAKKGWKGLWGVRNLLDAGTAELSRQSTINATAIRVGYAAGSAIYILGIILFLWRMASRRRAIP